MSADTPTPSDHTPTGAPNNSGIRDAFHHSTAPAGNGLDSAEIIRRSKKRRLPRQFGTGAALSLAVVGIGIAGFSGLGAGQGASSVMSDSAATSESSESSDSLMESDSGDAMLGGSEAVIGEAPIEKLNLCEGPLAEVAPSPSGLTISVDLPDAPAGSATIEGTATLTNNGTESVVGYSAASPALTLSQNGTVIWHSNGPMIMLAVDVDLDPGESLSYPVTLTPVVCGAVDDAGESFREDLPAAPAGEYQVSAAITVRGDATSDTVTGPLSDITLN